MRADRPTTAEMRYRRFQRTNAEWDKKVKKMIALIPSSRRIGR